MSNYPPILEEHIYNNVLDGNYFQGAGAPYYAINDADGIKLADNNGAAFDLNTLIANAQPPWAPLYAPKFDNTPYLVNQFAFVLNYLNVVDSNPKVFSGFYFYDALNNNCVLIGITNLGYFEVSAYNFVTKIFTVYKSIRLNLFANAPLQISVVYEQRVPTQILFSIYIPGFDIIGAAVVCSANPIAYNFYFLPLFPYSNALFADYSLLGDSRSLITSRYPANPNKFNAPVPPYNLKFSDAVVNVYGNNIVAKYSIKFYLSYYINVFSLLESQGSGQNYQSKNILVDNRKNKNNVKLSWEGVDYIIQPGDVFNISIVGNIASDISLFSQRWGVVYLYVMGAIDTSQYKTFN
jgi:hypothetical protein